MAGGASQGIRKRLAATPASPTERRDSAQSLALTGAAGVLIGAGVFLVALVAKPQAEPPPHFETCREARKAQLAPAMRGAPGYSPHLDKNNNGLSCEPFVDY